MCKLLEVNYEAGSTGGPIDETRGDPVLIATVMMTTTASGQSLPNLFPLPNRSGFLETYNVHNAPISLKGAFFQSLGTNGRSCSSCHLPTEGWSISAEEVQLRFLLTQGLDPIFRTNDGSNCDQNIDTSTLQERRKAYSLLLSRGLIRIALTLPEGAEFSVQSVNNPYGCSDTSTLSMYRRPLPSTNLGFLSTLMWDGRESTPPSTQKITYPNTGQLLADLAHQAMDATTGHAQGAVPTPAQVQDIVSFETALRTAQAFDFKAGLLNDGRATGGPVALASQPFFIGINDSFPASFGFNPTGAPFNPNIFNTVQFLDELANALSSQHCPGSGAIQFETDYDFRRRRNKRCSRTSCVIFGHMWNLPRLSQCR